MKIFRVIFTQFPGWEFYVSDSGRSNERVVTLENVDQLVKTDSKVEKMGILQERGHTNLGITTGVENFMGAKLNERHIDPDLTELRAQF